MNQDERKSAFIICNPAAGEGLAEKRWEKFRQQLDDNSLPYQFKLTEAPDHATDIARDVVRRGYKRIAIFGGDGTLNETLQGLAQFGIQVTTEVELLYFPAGSSCDFARKFPDDRSFIDRFQSQESMKIDICRVDCKDENGADTSRYFINNSSIGVISNAGDIYNKVSGISKIIKRISVDASAILSGISAIRQHAPYDCRITIDGQVWEGTRMSNLTVFKTPYFGGGMNYGVDCIQDSGIADVVLIEPVSRLRLLMIIPTLYTGTALKNKAAHHWQCKKFEIEAEGICIETDGEIAGYPPAKYTVLHQAIRVVL